MLDGSCKLENSWWLKNTLIFLVQEYRLWKDKLNLIYRPQEWINVIIKNTTFNNNFDMISIQNSSASRHITKDLIIHKTAFLKVMAWCHYFHQCWSHNAILCHMTPYYHMAIGHTIYLLIFDTHLFLTQQVLCRCNVVGTAAFLTLVGKAWTSSILCINHQSNKTILNLSHQDAMKPLLHTIRIMFQSNISSVQLWNSVMVITVHSILKCPWSFTRSTAHPQKIPHKIGPFLQEILQLTYRLH